MWKCGITIQAILVWMLPGIHCGSTSPYEQNSSVVQGSNAFSLELYKVLSNQYGNIIVSPLSVDVILSLIWVGAKGETAREIAQVLRLPQDRQQVENGFTDIHRSLQGNDAVTLDIANSLYVQRNIGIVPLFRRTAKQIFHANLQNLDFMNNIEYARQTINQWAEDRTHRKIKNLIPQGSLDKMTLMAVVNAIYFKGNWHNAFDRKQTKVLPFFVTSSRYTQTQMMHKREELPYGEIPELNVKVLKMRYKTAGVIPWTNVMSMLILLPGSVSGLAQLEKELPSLNLTSVLRSMSYREVELSLPRFKIESTIDMAHILGKMGIKKLFRQNAELSGIAEQSIYVSQVMQKSYVLVNEEGTEAAAVTQVVAQALSAAAVAEPVTFNANHPFLFLIMEELTQTILFVGRVSEPQTSW